MDPALHNLSLAQKIALLPEHQRAEIMAETNPEELLHDWKFWRRPTQTPPPGDWGTWLYMAGRGAGKALALDTPIPTPTGWTTMGDLQAGDEVLDEHGRPCRVLVAHTPYIPALTYRMTLSDHTSVVADADHQWVTWDILDRKRYNRARATGAGFPEDWAARPSIDTRRIAETLRHGNGGPLNHCIPVAGPLDLPEADLPLDPYLLGYWLGDGGSNSSEIHVHADDLPHLLKQIEQAGEECSVTEARTAMRVNIRSTRKSYKSKHGLTLEQKYAILESKGSVYAKDLAVEYSVPEHVIYAIWERDAWKRTILGEETFYGRLRATGLLGNKHIPQTYLRASRSQRAALLAGLLDSDGHMDPRKHAVEFVSTNERLARDVTELARTLGHKPVMAKGVAKLRGIEHGPKFRVTWRPADTPIVTLPRKAAAWAPSNSQTLRLYHRMIRAADPVAPVPVRCITVDSPNSMYLAGEGMIPTHNTRTASEWIHERVREGKAKRILLLGRTAADVRDVMLHGESGILNTGYPDERPEYFPSKRLLVWPDGKAEALLLSADEPDQSRGPQADTAWCIAEHQRVSTAEGPIPIQDVQVGQLLWTRSGLRPVLMVHNRGIKPVVKVVTTAGELWCTDDHRIWVQPHGWVEAGSLETGAALWHEDLTGPGPATGAPPTSADGPVRVLRVEPDGSSPTYDLTVDGAHEFFAGGILVHNCDEFASFPAVAGSDGATAFDNLRLALRLPVPGDMPRMILTTTPRRTKAMFDILEQAERPEFGIVVTKGTTYENLANLADTFRATILGLYEGTRLGQQELMGDMLADIEGALFKQEWFDANRVDALPPGRMYAVVGVDPSVADRPTDECGIVVVKATMERDYYRRHVYVVEDASVKGSPSVWAARVAAMARKWDAPIVAEGNQGGELVRMAIAQADGNLPVHIVHAKVGKATRAEPVAALFEQGRGHMVGSLPILESQATNWVPSESRYSPDRVDACVAEGTLVDTIDGQVPVQDIRAGDLVATRVGWREVLWAGVTGEDREVCEVVTDRGSFVATPDHLVWADAAWRRVDALASGMVALRRNGDAARNAPGWFDAQVLEVRPAGRARVYDLTVDEAHEFVADSHLVHNCTWAVLSVTTRQKGVSFAVGRHLRARSSRSKLPAVTASSFLRGSGGARSGRR